MQNKDNVLRVLNSVIASIETLRDDIADEDAKALTQRLERARQGRNQWWRERHPEAHPSPDPAFEKQSISSQLFGNLLSPRRKKSEDKD